MILEFYTNSLVIKHLIEYYATSMLIEFRAHSISISYHCTRVK